MAEKVKYEVKVKTGDDHFSGTNDSVYIVITGLKGETGKHMLDKIFTNDHEAGSTGSYSFEDKDVGAIEYITINKEYHLAEDDWYVDHVEVKKDGDFKEEFPVYKWLTKNTCSNFIVNTNKTMLPQHETELRKESRRQVINHTDLKWDKTDYLPKGIPGFISLTPEHSILNLDRNFSFPEGKLVDFGQRKVFDILNHQFAVLKGKLKPIEKFEEHHDVARYLGEHDFPDYGAYESRSGDWIGKWISKWKTDEEFGRQMLNGPNPICIRKMEKLPTNFPVTDDDIKGLLRRGLSLQQEIEAGNIYIIDHVILEEISCGKYQDKQLSLPVPMCMLYLLPNDQLVPIAIQLGQMPGPDFPIWTPNDKDEDWLLAKMWFKNGDVQVSQFRTHLFLGHLINESFQVALNRNFSPCHPVFKMMREHFDFIICNNVLARSKLIIPDGAADLAMTTGQGSKGMIELVEKSFKNFQYKDLDFPADIESRGVEKLPNYLFRDDALRLWTALSDYVKEMMNLYYKSDQDVKEDWELQSFVKDLAENGFKSETDGKDIGMPTSLGTIEDLLTLLKRFLFATVVGHSYANFLLFEYYRFPPNMPGTMLGAIPTEKDRGKTDEKKIVASLPTRELCAFQLGITWILSQYGEAEIWLGKYPRWLFTESEPANVVEKFKKELEKIEDIIVKRNVGVEFPYTVLQPSKIPAGVAI